MENEKQKVAVTHAGHTVIDDGDKVILMKRFDNESFVIEWQRKAELPSLAVYSTSVALSAESFVGTIKLGIGLLQQIDPEIIQIIASNPTGDHNHPYEPDEFDVELEANARRYFTWRDMMLNDPEEITKALESAKFDFEVDSILDKLSK